MAEQSKRTIRMFDTSLRMRADGPRGLAAPNNLRFLATSAWYVMDRMRPFHHQPVVPVTGGNGSVVVALSAEAARQVFTDNDVFHRPGNDFFYLPAGHPWSGMFEAVLTFNGDEHRRRRRLLMPVMQKSALAHYREVIQETFHGSRFAAGPGDAFDMMTEFLRVSKTNMLRCLLGLPNTPAHQELADRITTLLDGIVKPQVVLAQWNRGWTPYGRWLTQVARAYHDLAGLIEQCRAEPVRPDALSILCHTVDEDGDQLTTEEIAGELHGFFAAGFETTALTMTWAALTTLGSPDPDEIAPLDLTDERVLDAVVKESQRLLPATPTSLPRRVQEDVEIAGSPTVPAGSLLFTSPIAVHHQDDLYPDPFAFRPERWLDGLTPKPYEFFPFGMGARRCLGAAFADLQTRITLGLLARQSPALRLVTTRVDYRMKSGIGGAPRGPIMVEFAGDPPARLPRITGTITRYWKY